MMKIIKKTDEMQKLSFDLRSKGKKIVFVPTMGYFHEGHLSLMRWGRKQGDVLIVSLFVNPTQFGPNEDLSRYPRDLERDIALAEKERVDILFVPRAEDMYSDDHSSWVEVKGLSEVLCGKSRPGHFRGVCTVVCKLFNIVQPHIAVFGEKDWQQLKIIQKMVKDLNIPVKVVGRPIVREKDGLAMSSRNTYLSSEERKEATNIYKGLELARSLVKEGILDREELLTRVKNFYREKIPSGKIDYVELVHPERLQPIEKIEGKALLAVAIFIGKARLIDNILLEGA